MAVGGYGEVMCSGLVVEVSCSLHSVLIIMSREYMIAK